MSIWVYSGASTDKEYVQTAIDVTTCIFCNAPMEPLKSEDNEGRYVFEQSKISIQLTVKCCRMCGWWNARKQTAIYIYEETHHSLTHTLEGAMAVLRQLSLTDQSIPMEEIRDYLAAKYDARFNVDPWKFEEVVASVYRDIGFSTRVTARSGDEGIDVILDGPNDQLIGIQVKRYKNKIGVEQIRAFTGALLLKGITQGIFVTTSSFQSGAQTASNTSSMRGIPIDLVDAKRFYQALGIAQSKMYRSIQDRDFPFSDQALIKL